MKTANPQETRQLSLFRDAYLAIENRIVTLDFRPGALLTEKAIIDAVGIGRTPVREALQRLAYEGLIEVHPRSGIKIADIRPEDYVRVIEPRVTLEPLLVRSATRYSSPKDREMIADVLRDMIEVAEKGDVAGFLQQDKALDEAIAAAAANPFLPRILEPLQIHSRRFWFQYHGTDGLRDSAHGHANVCRALIAGDGDAAQLAMTQLMEYLLDKSKALSA